MRVAVLTDSVSDIKAPMAQQMGITVVPLYVHFKGQVLKDELEISTDQIFKGLLEGVAMPSTSQPTPMDFENAFRQLLLQNDHVLAITISGKLSGTVQSAALAAANFPGQVTIFDSQSASGTQAMMVERAQKLFEGGASVNEVVAKLEIARSQKLILFSVASLDFLKKNGRIGGAQALLGGLLNIKPILGLKDGRIEPVARVRGAQKALHEVIQGVQSFVTQHGASRAAYVYTDKLEDVGALRDACRDMGVMEFGVFQCSPVIASHVGPGTYGVLLEPVTV